MSERNTGKKDNSSKSGKQARARQEKPERAEARQAEHGRVHL